MSVVSVKVPKELKKRMDALRKYVDWNEELRRFIARRVEELEKEINMEEVMEMLKPLKSLPEGSAVKALREDRDSH